MMQPAPPPPGWYLHQGVTRWWDGVQWTNHVQPGPAAPPVVVMQGGQSHGGYTVKGVSQGEHIFHAIMTVFSCGLWLLVWIPRSLAGRRRMTPR